MCLSKMIIDFEELYPLQNNFFIFQNDLYS